MPFRSCNLNKMAAPGWAQILRTHGARFLKWQEHESALRLAGENLARIISTILLERVQSKKDAMAIWAVASDVQEKCNEQSTYEKPFAPEAYLWQHFLERYARTWRALEIMVEHGCLPIATYGVRSLDIGTGPGPSAFAVNDFYETLVRFAVSENVPDFNQPPQVSCVEYDHATNQLRLRIAAICAEIASRSAVTLCGYIQDFGTLQFTAERRDAFRSLRWQEECYYDEKAGVWDSELLRTVEEAHQIAESTHRYRLFVFSNFLTEVGTVAKFEQQIRNLLIDAKPGAVVLVLGGSGGHYPEIYSYVDRLTSAGGFQLVLDGVKVSSAETPLAELVYSEGRRFYDHLQGLAPNSDSRLRSLHQKFGSAGHPKKTSSTSVRVYRKDGPDARAKRTRLPSVQ